MSDLEELNIKIIRQRFKELEAKAVEQDERIRNLEGAIGNMQNLIDDQTKMIQNVWVSHNGSGGTENG